MFVFTNCVWLSKTRKAEKNVIAIITVRNQNSWEYEILLHTLIYMMPLI